MIGGALVFGLLVLAVAMAVLPPLRGREGPVAPGDERALRRAQLEARRDETYAALREAELDHRTGKLDETDHRRLRDALLAEAAETLRRLDELEGNPGAETGLREAPRDDQEGKGPEGGGS